MHDESANQQVCVCFCCLQSTHQSAEDHKNASDIGPSFSNLKSTGEKWDPSDKKRTL